MSFKNRDNEGGSFVALALAWIAIATIAVVILFAMLVAVMWFIEWLPATFGWAGILLFSCVVCYAFYKYV
mgnify:FL=1